MSWLKIRKYNLESYFSFVWPTITGHTCQFTSICSSGSAVSFPLCYSLMILADRGVGVMFSGKSSAKPFLCFSLIGIFGNLSSWWSSCIQSSPTDNVRLDPKKKFSTIAKVLQLQSWFQAKLKRSWGVMQTNSFFKERLYEHGCSDFLCTLPVFCVWSVTPAFMSKWLFE